MQGVTLVRESSEPSAYTKHDQLFKQLIHTFFEEFLKVFFPDVHQNINFQSITPLSEEVFTDLIEGDSRRLAIVVEATLKGQDTVIIIHVEPQSYVQSNFHIESDNPAAAALLSKMGFSKEEKIQVKKEFLICPAQAPSD